jgi:polysaccharide chain length determinant protein (PEP-CTERM system associated)
MTKPSDDRADEGLGVDFVLEIWMRRKQVALLVFAAAFAAVVSFTIWLPDLYSAKATVLVETQQVSQEFVRSSVGAGLESRIQTIQQELMSRERLADLVARFTLYPDLRKKGVAFDAIIARLRRDIRLEPTAVDQQGYGGNRTIAFAISYSGRDPAIVAQVANRLASLYVEGNTKIREGQAVRTAEFLNTQLANVKKDLDANERRVSEFNLGHIGELPQQVAANLASLERLNTQLRLNGENQIRAMDRRERLEKQLADAASAPAPAAARPALSPGVEQLANLRQQLEELKRKFTDQYPEVVRVRTELAALEQQLSERAATGSTGAAPTTNAVPSIDPTTRLSQAIEDTDTELKALKSEELALRQAIGGYEQRVENVPKRQEEFQALSRDYGTTKERYDALLKRYEEAQLAASLEQGQQVEQFRILDPAIAPSEPAAPNRLQLFVIGFVLSIGLALGAVLLAEKLDTTFHNVDELRAFVGMPTFSIPVIPTRAAMGRKWRQLALTAVSIAVGVALILAGSRYLASENERIVRLTSSGRV